MPDVAMPSTKNFCPAKNRMRRGVTEIAVAASVGPYLMECVPTRIASPAESVLFSAELVSIIGYKRSFQLFIKWKIPSVTKAGFDNGRVIVL